MGSVAAFSIGLSSVSSRIRSSNRPREKLPTLRPESISSPRSDISSMMNLCCTSLRAQRTAQTRCVRDWPPRRQDLPSAVVFPPGWPCRAARVCARSPEPAEAPDSTGFPAPRSPSGSPGLTHYTAGRPGQSYIGPPPSHDKARRGPGPLAHRLPGCRFCSGYGAGTDHL